MRPKFHPIFLNSTLTLLLFFGAFAGSESSAFQVTDPNIVLILCDDLGYGDVQCLNQKHGKIKTPNADQLAREGMVFTDAHSGSSVCTPTRYGLLTGRYSWRTSLQKGVVTGFAPCLIERNRPTIASFLKSLDYQTGIIGKWHLNFQYVDEKTKKTLLRSEHKLPPVGSLIPDGPLSRGFDYFHGFHHARDMKAVVENEQVIEHDAEVNMLPRLTRKCVEFIDSQAGKTKPFFLYVPLGSPHTPIVPSPAWKGKSGLGDYADFVMQTDHCVGQITSALEKNGLTRSTLVIFSSDNGCSKAAGIQKLAKQGHRVSGDLRGSKADIWDGGHRIPFIAKWHGKIEPGSTSDQLICLNDLFATICDITGQTIPNGSCEDSISFLPAFSGEPIPSKRKGIIHHSVSGHFAYRSANWKLALAKGSGGWSSPNEKQAAKKRAIGAQLYDLEHDLGETNNLFEARPDIANRMLNELSEYVKSGRSTPGTTSLNDLPNEKIKLWKSGEINPAKIR